MDTTYIGSRIDQIREARGYTIQEIANRMKMSRVTVHNHIQKGQMTLETLIRYAEVLGCTLSDLTDESIDVRMFDLNHDIKNYYPYNLAWDIIDDYHTRKLTYDEKVDMLYHIYVPELLNCLGELTDKEQDILESIYQHNLTLKLIGKSYNVGPERIRQIKAKALRKLRVPHIKYRWYLISETEAQIYQQQRDYYRLQVIQLEDKLKELVEKYNVEESIKVEPPTVKKSISIDELGLSVRPYNCLRRANINTLDDLENKTLSDMYQVRCLGNRSLEEIIDKMNEFGAKFKEES